MGTHKVTLRDGTPSIKGIERERGQADETTSSGGLFSVNRIQLTEHCHTLRAILTFGTRKT